MMYGLVECRRIVFEKIQVENIEGLYIKLD